MDMPKWHRVVTTSSWATKLAARTIFAAVSQKKRPVILALSGELGAGKTTFVQGLARILGIRERVQSPTFVLMKWYRLPRKHGPFRHLVHVDAYRLDRAKDARHLGLRHVFRDRDAIVVVEWAERIKKLIPKPVTWIRFSHGKRPS